MSKGLKALEKITEHLDLDDEYFYKQEKVDEDTIKQSLKALEIIKKKEVNIHSWHYNNCNKIPYEIYKQSIMTQSISNELLTQEEYNLLKEVLRD